MKLRIQYFAILREQRGASEEVLETMTATPRAIYDELRMRYRFTLPPDRVRIAVNDEFVTGETPLRDGDRIVFIPPVAGG